MDRGRHRAFLIVPGMGCAGLLALAGSLLAQTPTVAPATPAPAAATATPWVQASPPPTPVPPTKPANVTIRVDKEGRYYFSGEKDAVPADALTDHLRKLREAHGDDLQLTLRADRDADYAPVMALLSRLREAGIKNGTFSVPPGKASSPPPSPSPSASPSREEIAKAMARKREEELAKAASPAPSKPLHAEPQLSSDEREAYERNLTLWLAMPPEERQALRGQATERIREETERAYASLGLNLNDDQREVFALRYRQERRRLERELQEKAAAERARRLPEMMERLKREFPATAPAANSPKPPPKPVSTPTSTATATPSPTPAK